MIETFSNYLKYNRGLSDLTVQSYENCLREFAKYINTHYTGKRWSKVTKAEIDDYVAHLSIIGRKPASIKQSISALRTFYKTMMAMGADLRENPARYVSTPRLGEELPKIIEKEAIGKALASPTVPAEAKAAIAIIYETGIRLQELLDLRAKDIDPEHGSIIIRGKGNKQRTVYYGELTKKYGRCWHGEKHTQREVRHLVFNALKPYSQAEQLSPHALRHTFASELVNNGMEMVAIQKLLGHENIETTEIYAKLSNEKTKQLYLSFQPTLA